MRGAREDAELQRMGHASSLVGQEAEAKARRSTPAPSRRPSARWRRTPPTLRCRRRAASPSSSLSSATATAAPPRSTPARRRARGGEEEPRGEEELGEGHERLLGMCDALLKELTAGGKITRRLRCAAAFRAERNCGDTRGGFRVHMAPQSAAPPRARLLCILSRIFQSTKSKRRNARPRHHRRVRARGELTDAAPRRARGARAGLGFESRQRERVRLTEEWSSDERPPSC